MRSSAWPAGTPTSCPSHPPRARAAPPPPTAPRLPPAPPDPRRPPRGDRRPNRSVTAPGGAADSALWCETCPIAQGTYLDILIVWDRLFDVRAAGDWRERLSHVFRPPGWHPLPSVLLLRRLPEPFRARHPP
ncbi:hypothetical protein GCM10009802_55300 [Streptomyces synnematoformans]|uniref:Uncharacterized protein n=1 Tax=Streptomyces synnematoformans TaxID=415721 RepID=A0ABN1ZJX6_9ACTN